MDTSGRIPWAVLGIARDASLDDARRAFRRLAKSLHPDVGGDGTAFATVVAAYRAVAATTVAAGPGPASPMPRRVTPYDWTVGPASSPARVWAEVAPPARVWAEVAPHRTPTRSPVPPRSADFAVVLERELGRLTDAA